MPWHLRQSDDTGKGNGKATMARWRNPAFTPGTDKSRANERLWRHLILSHETGNSCSAGCIGTGIE